MMQRKYRIARLVYALVETVVTLVSFLLAYVIRDHLPLAYFGTLFPFRDYLGLLLVVVLLWNGLSLLIQNQPAASGADRLEAVKETALLVSLGGVLISTAIFLLKYHFISRPFILIFILLNFLFLLALRLFAAGGVSRFSRLLSGDRNLLIVGSDDRAARVAAVLEEAEPWGFHLVGIVPESSEVVPDSRLGGYPRIPLSRFGEAIKRHTVDEVIFVVSKDALASLEEVFLLCEEEGVKTRVMLSFFPHVTSKVYLEALQDLPLLTFTTTPQNDYLLLIKNGIDVVLAGGLLVLAAPLIALIALLIKTTSSGPVIFRQIRCGLGGREFVFYKFRSMVENAEAAQSQLQHLNEMSGPVFKIGKDPRCTPVGRFLRKFSLDELPQLINILKGNMSFVGPRPPLPQEVENYQRWQRRRLRMKPGLTCLWQVRGRNEIDFDEWMKLDLQYIDTWSLLLDIKIVLKTIPIVLLGKGA